MCWYKGSEAARTGISEQNLSVTENFYCVEFRVIPGQCVVDLVSGIHIDRPISCLALPPRNLSRLAVTVLYIIWTYNLTLTSVLATYLERRRVDIK